MKKHNFAARLLILAMLALPLMGNEGCDDGQNKEARILKKKTNLNLIQSRTFKLPGGIEIDFTPLINAQANQILATNKHLLLASYIVLPVANPGVNNCTLEYSQIELGGNVNSFEFVTSTGIQFGYNKDGEHSDGVGVGANVKVDKSEMELGLTAVDPLSRVLFSSGNASSKDTETTIGVSVDFDKFRIDPQYYLQTPLATVSRKALEKALDSLTEKIKDMPWEAQVIEDQDSFMIFNAGARSGLKVGDQFEVKNLEHFWAGVPCKSKYRGNVTTTKSPLAIIEVVELGADVAKGRVLERSSIEPIVVGARVSVKSPVQ